jgi:uncharacterized protein YeaO (DUF488 family)
LTFTVVKIKRAYEEPGTSDGIRILIDRLWPRGKTSEALRVEEWMKDVAPTVELIKWFGHDPAKWLEFKQKYKKQLELKGAMLDKLKQISRKGTLTLVYAAKDAEHNNAVVLKEVLDS